MSKKGEMLEKALVIMINAHSGQFDRGGQPYALHPLAVLNILNTADFSVSVLDEELQCMGILHDIIEDTKVTYKDLRDAGMTPRIVEGVHCLTKKVGQTYEEYCELLFTNLDAMIVKMADLSHNSDIRRLKGIREKDIERMVKYHKLYLELQQRVANWGK